MIIVIETSEEAQQGILRLASRNLHDCFSVSVGADQIEVVEFLAKEILASRTNALLRLGLVVASEHEGEVVAIGYCCLVGSVEVAGVIVVCSRGLIEFVQTCSGIIVESRSVRILLLVR